MLASLAHRCQAGSALATRLTSRPRYVPARQCSSSDTAISPTAIPIEAMTDEQKIHLLREEGIAPATGQSMKDMEAEVWDYNTNPVGPGHRAGLKILAKPLKGPLYASWYPEAAAKNPHNPIRLTDKQQRWQDKLKILRASGKGPPKKGSGKRSK